MHKTAYQERLIDELLENVRKEGYEQGYADATKKYAEANKGTTVITPATPEEIKEHGSDLTGWCKCGRPINGRWSGLINFCPWCGRIVTWNKT